MTRKERRDNDPNVLARREQHTQLAGSISAPTPQGGFPSSGTGASIAPSGGGYGVGNPGAKPAGGHQPSANPFMQPKPAGLTTISQTFLPNYYVDWNLSTWRSACDQAIKSGYTMSYATLVSWVFESSPFIQSLFEALAAPLGKVPFLFVDKNGKELPKWTEELCNKSWQKELRKEIGLAKFWGFSGLNFDPIRGKIYKYPMQDIDPISRMLKASTYSFFDGDSFDANDNLLFIQPSSSYESFLGWMQPISRSYIQMNITDNNWVAAGRKLAFPLMTVGYPQNDGSIDPSSGLPINEFKQQAENVVANSQPGKGLVYPYTMDDKGKMVKALEVEFEKTGTNAKAHEIFKDFNTEKKDEIREMVLGGTLTSDVGSAGSKALGTVHADKLEVVVMDWSERVETYLNDEYMPKIGKFYTNFPEGCKFIANKAKQMSLEDASTLSDILTANGQQLTDDFFESIGLAKNFFQPGPAVPAKPGSSGEENDDTLGATIATRTNLGSKKKS